MDCELKVGGIHAILIHGIGNPKPGSVKIAAQSLLQKAGVEDRAIYEFNWSQHVQQPVLFGHLTLRSFAELCKAILNSAWLGFEAEGSLPRGAARWFEGCLALFPLVGATALLKRFHGAAVAIFPVECCRTFHSFPEIVLPLWSAILAGLSIFLLVDSIFDRSLSLFLASCRRILLLAIWPIVYLILLPFLIPWAFALFVAFMVFTRACASIRVEAITQPDYRLELGILLGLLLVAAVLMIGGLIGCGLIAPQAKLLADVIRYLGLPGYRKGLERELRAYLAGTPIPRESRLLWIAHSLGSVIAADFLSAPDCPLDSDTDICLITFGSPLQRFFHRFFGQVYLKPAEMSESIRTRFPRFRWINLFRPFDYVGGRLDAAKEEIENTSTREYLCFHTGYWSDRIVADQVESALRQEPRSEFERGSPASQREQHPANLKGWDGTIQRLAYLWCAVFFVGLGTGYLHYIDQSRWAQTRVVRQSAQEKMRIDRDPVQVTGTLKRKSGWDRIGPPQNMEYIEYKVFELTFTPVGQMGHPMIVNFGKTEEDDPVFSDLKWKGNAAQVEVKYLKDHPEEFYLLGEEPKYSEELSTPVFAGASAFLFRSIPLGGLTWLIYVTLFGLLPPETTEQASRIASAPQVPRA